MALVQVLGTLKTLEVRINPSRVLCLVQVTTTIKVKDKGQCFLLPLFDI